MLNATIKLIIRDMQDVYRRARTMMVAQGAEARCARRLETLAARLSGMGLKINTLRARIGEGRLEQPVDADLSLRESLGELKEDIRDIRCQLAFLHGPYTGPRLQRAFERLSKIAEETYAAADKLQWEIAEHDARFERCAGAFL